MVERTRRQIRKVEQPGLGDFDDQLWPVNCAIIVLAGIVAGIVLALSDFQDPRPLYNGWVRLGGVGAAMVVLLVAMLSLQGRMLRRLQLCIVLSLLVHIGLALYLNERQLSIGPLHKGDTDFPIAERSAPVTVPEYHPRQFEPSEVEEDFEEPAKVTVTEEPRNDRLAKQTLEIAAQPNRIESVPREVLDPRRPDPVDLRRVEASSAPRRAEALAGVRVSRQEADHRPATSNPVAQPQVQTKDQPLPDPLRSQAAEAERRRDDVPSEPNRPRPDPTQAESPSAVPRVQRTAQTQTPSVTESARARMEKAEVAAMARPQAEIPQLSAAQATPQNSPEARAVPTQRQAISAALSSAGQSAPAAANARAVASQIQRADRTSVPESSASSRPAAELARRASPAAQVADAKVEEPAAPQAAAAANPSALAIPSEAAAERNATASGQAAPGSAAGMVPVEMSQGSVRPLGTGHRAESGQQPAIANTDRAGSGNLARTFSDQPGLPSAADAGLVAGDVVAAPAEGPAVSTVLSSDDGASAVGRQSMGVPTTVAGQPGGIPDGQPAGPGVYAAGVARPDRDAAGPSEPSAGESNGSVRTAVAQPTGALAGPVEVEVPSASPGDGASVAAGGAPAPTGAGDGAASLAKADAGAVRRQGGGVPLVEIAARSGPGGLDVNPAAVIGVPDRLARPESQVVHTPSQRFIVERSGGGDAMEGRLREMSKESFRQRDPGTRGQTARARGGSAETERAVELGLDYLARHQFPDGHWSVDRFPSGGAGYEDAAPGQMNADTAGTGLALLAFLGAGYTHREEKYGGGVGRGIDWLVANQNADGHLYTDQTDQTPYGRIYGHGIATIALCEAYGMTKDAALRAPAEKAIQYILQAQHPTYGGWRYQPRKESDTSVSGWQLMALRSAQMAGLKVPDENLLKVGRWLDLAQAANGSRYRYNPYAADTDEQRQGREPNRTMTAEGLLMRMYLGWQRDHAALVEGADFLEANLPENGESGEWLRDAYYWYYGTQVMFHMQGNYWAAWNSRLHPLLEQSQVQTGPLAGSWDPNRPVPDRWAHAAGRHYVTCLDLLMLEVYYRHLPLYQTLAK